MREHSLFLRASTRTDLLADRAVLSWLQQVEDFAGDRFACATDLAAVRAEPLQLDQRARQLDELLPAGVHVRARLRLEPAAPRLLRSLEIHAGAHPYSGAHVTQLDLRLDLAVLAEGGACDRFAAFFERIASGIDATWAYAHPTDDNAIQNATSAALIRLGYGVEVDPAELPDMPGREVSRGEFRYAPEWLGWNGAAMVERLEPFAETELPACVRNVGAARCWRLAPRPEDVDTPQGRALQRTLRRTLGFDAAAAADRWTLGYWQRRGTT